MLVIDTGDVWGLREACPWPGGVPLALFRAIQGHQARHQEREEKHTRDRLQDRHQACLGGDRGAVAVPDRRERHEAKEDEIGRQQLGRTLSGGAPRQRWGMNLLQQGVDSGEREANEQVRTGQTSS
jgi:hypothetical protein